MVRATQSVSALHRDSTRYSQMKNWMEFGFVMERAFHRHNHSDVGANRKEGTTRVEQSTPLPNANDAIITARNEKALVRMLPDCAHGPRVETQRIDHFRLLLTPTPKTH